MKFNSYIFLAFAVITLGMCQQKETDKPQIKKTPELAEVDPNGNYWYQGKAELCSYEVEQERYGEIRKASEVLVFVTEDFSANKQVKLDAKPAEGDTKIPILKLNTIRRFQTGIYDYSLTQSVFTPMPIDKKDVIRSLKLSATIQDWCGHVFVQANALPESYRIRSFSYFESEGDTDVELNPGLLEDEIWTLLRLDPDSLDSLEVTVMPGIFYSRFRHVPLAAEPANITINQLGETSELTLQYKNIPRTLEIRFETAFPHRIMGWEETLQGKLLSRGTLKNVMLDDYWRHHDEASSGLHEQLIK
ncbi:MAG: hypothetical protein R3A50_03320 [Saprospiraceae bacterium]